MKLIATISMFILSLNFAYAHGDEHGSSKKSEGISHESIDNKLQMIKGQLIGLTCFVKHSSKGAGHIECLKDCANKGLPIGVLTKDNKIYQISGEGHGSLKETNKKFLKYAEQIVMLKGKVFSSNGVNMIVVKAIKKAN